MTEDAREMIQKAARELNEAYAGSSEMQGCCGGASSMASQGCGCHSTISSHDGWEDKLRAAINKVRPFLQMDGGDMELLAIEDKNAIIRLTGACNGCPSALMHMKQGVEQAIKKELHDFGELVTVDY